MSRPILPLTVLVVAALVPAPAGAVVPVRLWATYIGGADTDTARAAGVDAAGHVYVCLDTSSDGLGTPGTEAPESLGNHDIVLLKFAPDGVRLWATYVGGGGDDDCGDVAVDPTGRTAVVGRTFSMSGVATPGAIQSVRADNNVARDGMVITYDPNGKRLWGTYFGSPGTDQTNAAAFDPDGNLYIGGVVPAPFVFPLPPGAHDTTYNKLDDGYVAKLSPTGELLWATYYGGTSNETVQAIAVVGPDMVIASGDTSSSTGIATPELDAVAGGFDAFVVRLDPAGQRAWGTYFGGPDGEYHSMIAADAASIYLAGYTKSKVGLSTAGAHQIDPGLGPDFDGFLARLTPAGELD